MKFKEITSPRQIQPGMHWRRTEDDVEKIKENIYAIITNVVGDTVYYKFLEHPIKKLINDKEYSCEWDKFQSSDEIVVKVEGFEL